MRVGVVIPVYNERPVLGALMERLRAAPCPAARFVVLVDDGSTDGTERVIGALADESTVVCRHDRNRGKGAALRTGFAAALSRGADVVMVQDADLEYDPMEHGVVLGPILSGWADVVIGSRYAARGGSWRDVQYSANRVITAASNVMTGLTLTDVECCLKAFRSEVAGSIEIEESRFGVEPELVAKAARARIGGRPARIFEVPVSFHPRSRREGKKIGWRDGVSALRCVWKYAWRVDRVEGEMGAVAQLGAAFAAAREMRTLNR